MTPEEFGAELDKIGELARKAQKGFKNLKGSVRIIIDANDTFDSVMQKYLAAKNK